MISTGALTFHAESPGGAHHGGAQHSSDIAVNTEVLRFVCDPHTNLSKPALAILLTVDFHLYPSHILLLHIVAAFTIALTVALTVALTLRLPYPLR